jgi:hypothetical protein
VRHFYLRDAQKFPVACVASKVLELVGEGDARRPSRIAFAVSARNPKDTFSRDMARYVAYGRLQMGLVAEVNVEEGQNVKRLILEKIANEPVKLKGSRDPMFMKQRVRNAAKLWLDSHSVEFVEAELV